MQEQISAAVFTTGIGYADSSIEVDGDYKHLAFLSFSTLELIFEKKCPLSFRAEIGSSLDRAELGHRSEIRNGYDTAKVISLSRSSVADTFARPRKLGAVRTWFTYSVAKGA
jgi:hypothetical protein